MQQTYSNNTKKVPNSFAELPNSPNRSSGKSAELPNTLFISVRFGSGHSAAEQTQQEFGKQKPQTPNNTHRVPSHQQHQEAEQWK